jgi:hypothetical protein
LLLEHQLSLLHQRIVIRLQTGSLRVIESIMELLPKGDVQIAGTGSIDSRFEKSPGSKTKVAGAKFEGELFQHLVSALDSLFEAIS